MSPLSKAQRLVLVAAAEHADGAVLPLPDALAVRGRARQLMLEGLIRRGLIAKAPGQDGEPVLAITPEGRTLVRSADLAPSARDEQPVAPATPRADADAPAATDRPAVRAGTKQALLVDLLRRQDGATIAEIQQATGWLPHTARAALTGLKKKSFTVTSARRGDGTRAYHLTSKDNDQDQERA